MLEIEKEFIITREQKERLLKKAVFLRKKTFQDIYFDDSRYSLTTKDWWLRTREGRFELKIHRFEKDIDVYDELDDMSDILSAFELHDKTLEDFLKEKEIVPFIELTTERESYEIAPFTIEFDTATYANGFTYSSMEVELLVNKAETSAEEGAEKIIKFAEQYEIKREPVLGKVLTYMKNYLPDHFQVLETANILSPLQYDSQL